MAGGSRLVVVLMILAAAGCRSSSSGGGSTGNPPNPPNPSAGLDQRPSNLTCVAPALTSGAGGTIALMQVFANLAFSEPLAMLQAPGDSSRWFVLQKTGRVRVFQDTPNVGAFDADFIDLPAAFPAFNSGGEGGLLGMAFHPSYAANRQVFLSWTENGPSGWPMVSVVARFTSNNGGLTLDPGTRLDIIRVNQPYTNHNGGQITFGPDGFLYFGLGDGGSGGDPQGHAQDTTDVLGDMLRVDVNDAAPYTIPPSNPFFTIPGSKCPADHTSTTNCPEIYAWGLRNPWRWSFDRANGDLWAGDVGQGAREEIDRIQRGGNYGWNCREGSIAYPSPTQSCSTAFVEPLHDYDRNLGASVTGGYVYRGSALPALVGRYVFGDFISGRIWRLNPNGSGGFTSEQLVDTNYSISSFGEGNDGELYVVDYSGGGLYRIVDGGGGQPGQPPVATQLSATGCVSQQNPALPASGLVPYSIQAPFWSDSATKERWLALPNGTTIQVQADGDFVFPPGTVLMKHFRLGAILAETRLFMRHPDGTWAGYSYEWNQQQSDATLVQGGKVATIPGTTQSWIFPSGNDCLTCHTAAAGFALGLETAQLNRDFTYPATGRTANQLATLDAIGMFAAPLGNPTTHPRLADTSALNLPLTDRARAYLHSNCAHCHRAGGPTPSPMDLRYATMLQNTLACDAVPQSGDLGLGSNARIIAVGNPTLSVLLERIRRRDATGMPPIASTFVDPVGVQLIQDWITGLTSCM